MIKYINKWIIIIISSSEISHEQTSTWLRKRNLKRKTESLLIAENKNPVRTNYVKAKIGKMQQNNKCKLCGDREET